MARCLIEFPQMLGVTFLTLFLAIVPIGDFSQLFKTTVLCCIPWHSKTPVLCIILDSVNLYVFYDYVSKVVNLNGIVCDRR